MDISVQCSVQCEDKDQFEQAARLAGEFGISLKWQQLFMSSAYDTPYYENPSADFHNKSLINTANNTVASNKVFLSFKDGQFALNSEDGLSLKLSFLTDLRYRRNFQSPKKELISKACGWHLGYRNVLDLTAGLAGDSVFLTKVGFQVTSLERQPMLFLLLKAAQKSALNDDAHGIWSHLKFINSEASDYLNKQITLENAPEVIYYDPMYPSTTKTALPSKEMQIFRQLLGENEADVDLLALAINKTAKIVVVKRPIKALPLQTTSNLMPTRAYLGKLVRFDVYTDISSS
jgi:16S rRNA (guanine1516-N2)-methyltransferase